MTGRLGDQLRLAGTFVTVDGPGGVGKSAVVKQAVDLLRATGLSVHATTQPSRTELGDLARHGTAIYRGMSLACLCAADRHHQLDVEIKPALRKGAIVVCDRYVASSLVLQGLDGVSSETVWRLNHGIYRPDLAVILEGDPAMIAARLRARGAHSRFERAENSSDLESRGYALARADLRAKGWPVEILDCTIDTPEVIASRIVSLIHRTLVERARNVAQPDHRQRRRAIR